MYDFTENLGISRKLNKIPHLHLILEPNFLYLLYIYQTIKYE